MEWDEACRDFAGRLDSVEEELEAYLSAHGAALQDEVLAMTQSAVYEAGDGKFEDVDFGPVKSIAERILNTLEKVEAELRQAVQSQSAT